MEDKVIGLMVTLNYNLYTELDVITRSIKFVNQGKEYWNKENCIRNTIGTSSPQQAPFLALVRKDTNEDSG